MEEMNDLKNHSDSEKANTSTYKMSQSSHEVVNKIDRFLSFKYDASNLSTLKNLPLIKILYTDKMKKQ
jgi:hypothetical protein